MDERTKATAIKTWNTLTEIVEKEKDDQIREKVIDAMRGLVDVYTKLGIYIFFPW